MRGKNHIKMGKLVYLQFGQIRRAARHSPPTHTSILQFIEGKGKNKSREICVRRFSKALAHQKTQDMFVDSSLAPGCGVVVYALSMWELEI